MTSHLVAEPGKLCDAFGTGCDVGRSDGGVRGAEGGGRCARARPGPAGPRLPN